MSVHWTAFSKTDTSKVCISKETARAIAKDLLAGDECKKVLLLTDSSLKICERQLITKDKIIAYGDSIIAAKDTINKSQAAMYATLQSEYALLHKKYKKQKRRGVLKTIGNVALISGIATLFIVK